MFLCEPREGLGLDLDVVRIYFAKFKLISFSREHSV